MIQEGPNRGVVIREGDEMGMGWGGIMQLPGWKMGARCSALYTTKLCNRIVIVFYVEPSFSYGEIWEGDNKRSK